MTARRFLSVRVAGWVGLLSAALLSACSVWRDGPKPTPLESVQPQSSARLVWSASDGRVDFPMRPVIVGNQVASASSDGLVRVRAFSSPTPLWSVPVGAALSAGVGFDGQRVAVVTQSNELVVVSDGKVVWRKRLASGASTPPLVAGERVFVLGLDRAVDAYDALDGRYLWRLQRTSDPLSLRLPSVLMPYGDLLVVGQGARLVGVDPLRGTARWELGLATPRGSNEVERLSDLVGPAARRGDIVCARAFQATVSCGDLSRNALTWTRNTGGATAVALTAEAVVGADNSDRLTGWRAGSGELLWTHERLLNRRLGGVSAWGDWVAVGDLEGQVHVLDPKTGQTVMRLPTDGSAIPTAPVTSGKSLVVSTRRGGLYLWQTP